MSTEQYHFVIGYHANCIDGFTSAWVAHNWIRYGNLQVPEENIHCIPLAYQDDAAMDTLINMMETLESDTTCSHFDVMILDFSVPYADLELWTSEFTKLERAYVIDHHASAIRQYEELPKETESITLYLSIEHSGAQLTWNFLYDILSEVPQLVQYVSDYDTWQKKLLDVDEINAVLRVTPKTFSDWDLLAASMETSVNFYHIVEKGRAIRAYHDSIVTDLIKTATPIELCGEKGLAVNCSRHFASDVGHALAVKSGTFGACWYQDTEVTKFSLRSAGDYDVSVLAEKFGGGGHKGAAGFVLSPETPDMFPDSESEHRGIKIWRA